MEFYSTVKANKIMNISRKLLDLERIRLQKTKFTCSLLYTYPNFQYFVYVQIRIRGSTGQQSK